MRLERTQAALLSLTSRFAIRAEVFECKICCVTVTAQEHLIAHLNGARHKLQVRKLDANENYRGENRHMYSLYCCKKYASLISYDMKSEQFSW